jgi:hypothetical protein
MNTQIIPPLNSMIRTETITGVRAYTDGRYEIATRPDATGEWCFAFRPSDGVAPQIGETATFYGEFLTVDVLDIDGRIYRIAG